MIGNRYSMRVAAEILQRMFSAAERALAIDDPVTAKQSPEQSAEGCGRLQMAKASMEAKSSLSPELPKAGYKFASEYPAQDFHGQEEVAARRNPAVVIGR